MTPRSALCSRQLLMATAASVLTLFSACTDTRDTPEGRGSIRAIHAMADIGAVSFQIEARSLDRPEYLEATTFFDYDSLTYDFHFDYNSALTGSVERLATTELSVAPSTDYTLFLTGSLASPRIAQFQQPSFESSGNFDVLEGWAVNLSETAGDIDLYVGPPGFDPASIAASAADVARDGIVSMGDISAEEIQVVATPAGDPGTELVRTEPATLVGDDRVFFSLFDSAGESTLPYLVVLTGENGSVTLVDDNAPVRLQAAHASAAEGPLDVYHEPEDGPLTTPVFANLAAGDVSVPVDLPAADDVANLDATLTPAGDPGVVLLEGTLAFADGRATLEIISGTQADDTLNITPVLSSRRSLADSARLGLYNAIAEQELVDIYLLEPGEDFDRADSRTLLNNAQLGQSANQFRTPSGVYTLYVVRDADDVVLLGPVDVDLAVGDVVQLVTTDTADPNVSGLIEIDLTVF